MNEFLGSQNFRVQLTKKQSKDIENMYKELLEELEKERQALLPRTNVSSVIRSSYIADLQQQINKEMQNISYKQERLIRNNISQIAGSVVEDNVKLLNKIGINVTSAYSYVPRQVVNKLATGELYKGKWTLSSSIWGNSKKTLHDIDMIIAKGIAGQKSTYDIAKDLEKYVNPSAKKDWAWSKVYPGTARKVDYNAQRLARTMISHAYQEALVETTKNNPFVVCYEWLTSVGDRVCPICEERESGFHGVVINGRSMHGCYYEEDLPLDHPNGMCTIAPYIEKDYDAIADRLADWVNGKTDRELDVFANDLGYTSRDLKKTISNS